MAVALRNFIPIQPEEILNGPFGDWLLLIILAGLLIAICGAVLPKKLVEKRYGKSIVIFTGLILGIGLFKAKDIYNFNLESFGFMAIWLIILVMGFVIYGLSKIGIPKDISLALTYCITFLSFFLLSPSLFDAISESFPLVNLIFIILFFYMLAKPIFSFFKSKSPLKAARKLERTNFQNSQDVEVDRESAQLKEEVRQVKRHDLPVSKKEISSINDMDNLLAKIFKVLSQKGNALTKDDKNQITEDLKLIYRDESILQKAAKYLHSRSLVYKQHHQRDIQEVRQRLQKTTSQKQKELLQNELKFHNTMLEVLDFIKNAESSKSGDFIRSFNSLITRSIDRLTKNRLSEAL
ncbi:MAG: hypothetical protein MJB14_13095, partial [Spirochaetes bacterium]|nr:hypothetical protein [Spirochaetota bacterium]